MNTTSGETHALVPACHGKIDLRHEEVVTFLELARRIGRRRANRPTHVSTLHRWRLAGLGGIRLQALKHGGIWVTTIQAYERFMNALTQAASNEGSVMTVASRPSMDQTNHTLDKLGL